MKGFLSIVFITGMLLVMSAIADEKESPRSQPAESTIEILNQGNEPRYLLKNKFLPGKYLMMVSSKSESKVEGDSEPMEAAESQIKFDMFISKPDKNGIKEIVIKPKNVVERLQGMKSDSIKTRERAMAKLNGKEDSQPKITGELFSQDYSDDDIKFLCSTKKIKIGPNGEVISVVKYVGDSAPDSDVENSDQKKVKKLEQFDKPDWPDVPVGVAAEWLYTENCKAPWGEKYEIKGKARFSAINKGRKGECAIIKKKLASPKLELKGQPEISSMKMTIYAADVFNLEKGYMRESVIQTRTEIERPNQAKVLISQSVRQGISLMKEAK